MKPHLIRRIYVILALAAWPVGIGSGLYVLAFRNDIRGIWLVAVTMLLALPAVPMLANLAAFPFAYSVFGDRLQPEFPVEAPRRIIGHSWGRVGKVRVSWPGATWFIFSEGLGLRFDLVGRAYVPWDMVIDIQPIHFGQFRLTHRCPCVRNPIDLPATAAAELTGVFQPK
jgi:hypothetical protein